MSEMKWIKIVTDIVDDEKMLMIEMLCPNGAKRDAVQLMWFNVLTLAGKLNEGGRLAVNGIPMDTKALGKKFRRTTRTVEFAFDLFMKLGMIRQDEDGAYCVTNWGRYQSDMSEKADKAEYDKKRYQDKKVKAETLKSEKESEIKVEKSENSTFSTGQNKNKEIEEEINISADADINILSGRAPVAVNGNDPQKMVQKENISTKTKNSRGDDKFSAEIDEIVMYLNQKANKNFFTRTEPTRQCIRARLSEGHTVEDFKKVIDNKVEQWLGTENDKYLRPETLFCPKHFDSYRNENPAAVIPLGSNKTAVPQSTYNQQMNMLEQYRQQLIQEEAHG